MGIKEYIKKMHLEHGCSLRDICAMKCFKQINLIRYEYFKPTIKEHDLSIYSDIADIIRFQNELKEYKRKMKEIARQNERIHNRNMKIRNAFVSYCVEYLDALI